MNTANEQTPQPDTATPDAGTPQSGEYERACAQTFVERYQGKSFLRAFLTDLFFPPIESPVYYLLWQHQRAARKNRNKDNTKDV